MVVKLYIRTLLWPSTMQHGGELAGSQSKTLNFHLLHAAIMTSYTADLCIVECQTEHENLSSQSTNH